MIKRIISVALASIVLLTTLLSVASCSAFITLKSPFLTDAVVVSTDNFKITGTMFSAAIYSDYNSYRSAMKKYGDTLSKGDISVEDFLSLSASEVYMAVNYYCNPSPVAVSSNLLSVMLPNGNGDMYFEDKYEAPAIKYDYSTYGAAPQVSSALLTRPSTSLMQGSFGSFGGGSNNSITMQPGLLYSTEIDAPSFDLSPISAWNGDESLTYSDVALEYAKQIIGKCEYARAKGISVDEDEIVKAREELESAINTAGQFFTADDFIKQMYGNTTTEELVKFLELYYLSEKADELLLEEFASSFDEGELDGLVQTLSPVGGFRDILYIEVVDYIPNGLARYYESIGGYEQNYEAHKAKLASIIDRLRNASNDEDFINAAKEYIHMAAFYDFFERIEDNLGENYFYEMVAYVVEDAVAYLDNLKLVIDSYFSGDDNYGAPVSNADAKFPSEFEDAFIYAASGAINRIDNLFYYELAAMSEVSSSSDEFARWIFDENTDIGECYYSENESYVFSSGTNTSTGSISNMERRTVMKFARMSDKYDISNHPTYSYASATFEVSDRFYSMIHAGENLLEKVNGDSLSEIKKIAISCSAKYRLHQGVSFTGSLGIDRWLSTRSGEIPDKNLIVTNDGVVAVFMVECSEMTASEYKAYNVLYSRALSTMLEEYYTEGNLIVNSNFG